MEHVALIKATGDRGYPASHQRTAYKLPVCWRRKANSPRPPRGEVCETGTRCAPRQYKGLHNLMALGAQEQRGPSVSGDLIYSGDFQWMSPWSMESFVRVYKGQGLGKDKPGCTWSQLGSLQGLCVNNGTGDAETCEGKMIPRHLLTSLTAFMQQPAAWLDRQSSATSRHAVLMSFKRNRKEITLLAHHFLETNGCLSHPCSASAARWHSAWW